MERIDGSTRMTIPLADPIGPGRERRLVMSTRRTLPRSTSARVAFSGFPLANAREQAGAIGITVPGNPFVSGAAARGGPQLDPPPGRPARPRARPPTAPAYQFPER